MALYNRELAARRAEAARTNVPGTCQLWTRTMFGAPSAGDRDRDGDADAVDGWKSEPEWAKHYGDRRPPRGVPVAFTGGSRGYGHRAVSLGDGWVRSTDMAGSSYRAGVVGTTTIADIERAMGVKYVGWSETITGTKIPMPEWTKKTRGKYVDVAIKKVRRAERKSDEGTPRDRKLSRALNILTKIKHLPRRLKK